MTILGPFLTVDLHSRPGRQTGDICCTGAPSILGNWSAMAHLSQIRTKVECNRLGRLRHILFNLGIANDPRKPFFFVLSFIIFFIYWSDLWSFIQTNFYISEVLRFRQEYFRKCSSMKRRCGFHKFERIYFEILFRQRVDFIDGFNWLSLKPVSMFDSIYSFSSKYP